MRERIKEIMPRPLIRMYQGLREIWIKLLFVVFWICPVNRKRIVLCNVWGYGDNARYVTDELVREGLSYDIVFVTNHPEQSAAPPGVRVLKTNSPAAVHALATARVWVDNNRKEPYILKRRGQYYIQTWHGGLSLKRIEGDCRDMLGEAYIRNAKRDSEMTDLYLSNSRFCTNMYRSAFWYRGEILECGSPRVDCLLRPNPDRIRDTRKRLGVPDGVRLAIYAPTYRGRGSTGKAAAKVYNPDPAGVRRALSGRFGGMWVILVRLHPLAEADSRHIRVQDGVIDVTDYRDLYELLEAGEVLITDYSNTMFEFALSGHPVFLYANDVGEYQAERGFYHDYYSLPFPHASDSRELIGAIQGFREEEYAGQVQEFFRTIELYEDGYASERVAERIRTIMG